MVTPAEDEGDRQEIVLWIVGRKVQVSDTTMLGEERKPVQKINNNFFPVRARVKKITF